MVTPDTGGTENFLPIGYSPMQGPITPAAATEVVIPPLGQYIREDGTPSFFSDVFEAWWWCLQTLTSEGYGVPWAPVSPTGKIIAIFAALFGTIILALPIAVVGVTFDDEWVKQAKINKFAVSRSPHYNAPTAALPFAHTLSFPPSPHAGRVLRIRVQSDHPQRHTRRARPLQEKRQRLSVHAHHILPVPPNAKEHNTRLAKRTGRKQQQHRNRNRRSSSSPFHPNAGEHAGEDGGDHSSRG
jgi:hypothetical protein